MLKMQKSFKFNNFYLHIDLNFRRSLFFDNTISLIIVKINRKESVNYCNRDRMLYYFIKLALKCKTQYEDNIISCLLLIYLL